VTVWTVTNLKPGTAKTTSAVWLAHAVHEAGFKVLLVDADPGGAKLALAPHMADGLGSAGRWNALAPFPFDMITLASKDLHRALPPLVAEHGFDVVIIDSPPIEDHQGIALSALRVADLLVIPLAPTSFELDRMAPLGEILAEVDTLRATPARSFVLLNRCVANAASTEKTADALTDSGYRVLRARVGRLETYAQSHGTTVTAKGTAYETAAGELLAVAGVTR
jgi:chromosome partitioning protein